jgi:formate dehydrogenase subunit beta
MNEMRELAAKLLTEGTVKVVIGYEEGPAGVRPAFVTDPAKAETLIFDSRCVQNLAVYLNPRRSHVAKLGKVAIMVKGCDAKAVAGLVREHQVKREDLVIIGVRCGGVVRSADMAAELTAETVADRCQGCEVREPKFCDYLVLPLPPPAPISTRREEKLAELAKMTTEERWAYWSEQLERCIRCHACREVCPLCFCVQCVADMSQPQWIPTSPTLQGNVMWQMTRVMHLAGRCVDCQECERACPVGIPLGLLNSYVARNVEKRFDYKTSEDQSVAAPMGDYRTDDEEEFIL